MIVVAAIGASSLASLMFHTPQRALIIKVIAFVIVTVLVTGFSTSIRRISRMFREQDRLRRQLMADVAHELRTPLSILQGRLEGVIDGVYARDDAQISALLDQTKHLSRLVEDLQTLATAEAGALHLQKELIEPAELIRDVAESFGRPIAVNVDDALPAINIDPVRIREVLLNLLSNAVRYTPPEGTISIDATAQTKRLIIRVRDTGSGIPADELPHIFDRFHKRRDSPGSGLGLSIARGLVQAHGGEIDLASEAGRGTTVTVAIPR